MGQPGLSASFFYFEGIAKVMLKAADMNMRSGVGSLS
jgi:hypothetical protein